MNKQPPGAWGLQTGYKMLVIWVFFFSCVVVGAAPHNHHIVKLPL